MKQFFHKIFSFRASEGLAVVLTGFILFFSTAAADRAHGMTVDGESRVHVTADRLVSRQADRVVEFSGNVRATQAGTIITADTLTIVFRDGARPPAEADDRADSLEKLSAAGNVHILHENWEASCDEAIYTSSDELLVLMGDNVEIKEAGRSISGREVVFNRQTGEISVSGKAGTRVEAIFDYTGETGVLPGTINREGGR